MDVFDGFRHVLGPSQRASSFVLVTHNVLRYNAYMIVSFRNDQTATIWSGRRSRRLPGDIEAPALRKLRLTPSGLKIYAYHLAIGWKR
jgi:hypothetical protein